jgi:hypothetical protein
LRLICNFVTYPLSRIPGWRDPSDGDLVWEEEYKALLVEWEKRQDRVNKRSAERGMVNFSILQCEAAGLHFEEAGQPAEQLNLKV